MCRNCGLKCVASVGILFVFLTASFTMARDNDDKKDRSNQGGRSSSNSGNSASSASRGISSSSSSGQSRSSAGSDSSRSFSGRSSQSVQIPSSDRATRSFSSGNSGTGTFSAKSFSGSSNRSSDNKSSTTRSSSSQTVARPIDGAIPNRNGGTIGVPYQGFTQGNTSTGKTSNSANSDNNPRGFFRGSNNSSTFSRFAEN